MKKNRSRLSAYLITGALLTAIVAAPTVGSAAGLANSPFYIKALNSQSAGKIFGIRPLLKQTPVSTPAPTATSTPSPTTTPGGGSTPTPTPTGGATSTPTPTSSPSPSYPPASPEIAFSWSMMPDGTARLDSMGAGYGITDVVIPQTATVSGASRKVTAIAASAFQNRAITSVVMPDSINSIGSYAFDTNKLTSIKFPAGLTSIAAGAFSGNQLTSVVIPDRITSIGLSAFSKNAISSLTLSSSLATIPVSAFDTNNLTSVTIPASVTSIGGNAFSNNKLQSVSIPNTVTTIDNSAFRSNSITSLSLGTGLKTLGDFVFFNNPNLPDNLEIPASMTSMGNRTLESATLKNIRMAGNAPTTFSTGSTNPTGTFGSPTGKKVYYKSTATGYTSPTWKGYSTATY